MNKFKDMGRNFRLSVAQLNPCVGDILGNLGLVQQARERAAKEKADLVLFSELFISGYPPEDLVLKPAFVHACEKAMEVLVENTRDGGPGVIVGTPLLRNGKLYNAIAVLDNGKVIAERYKIDLPNYAEFDEKRVFSCGKQIDPVIFRGISLGLPVCEDIWNHTSFCKILAKKGARLILVANASPFGRRKSAIRLRIVERQVKESGLPIVYVNQFGGQDELVFDGGSFALQADGNLAFRMKHFQEDILTTVWEETLSGLRCIRGETASILSGYEADYNTCVLGLRDYVQKNDFKSAILGLSGGIDSALCAAIAVDALGAENVRCIMLPYRYTSQASLEDAQTCANFLGCPYDIVPIFDAVEGLTAALQLFFSDLPDGIIAENLQSRVRGSLLMTLSNKFGSIVLTTGNKSEISVGYTTLYGDMNGGFNPIRDLYKTQVYALSKWRNIFKPESAKGPEGVVIPQNILEKAPSAELREGQQDQDALPPYPVLDTILECLVEKDMNVASILACGYDKKTVQEIEDLFYAAEYKRRQSALGTKITNKHFGRDRRYPITNRFRSSFYDLS